MVSTREALKEVKVAYKSTVYENDYLFVLRNGEAYWTDDHGSHPTELSSDFTFSWKRIDKKNLPDGSVKFIKWMCTL